MSRRRRSVLGLPVAIVLVAVGLKLLSLGFFAGRGQSALAAGDAEVASAEFGRLATVNLVERWKAPYNAGVAEYVDGDFAAAEEHFRDALELADRCDVRINLALALEAQGDAGEPAAAAEEYLRGIEAVIGDSCSAGDLAADASTVSARLQAKLDGAAPDVPLTTTPDPATPGSSEPATTDSTAPDTAPVESTVPDPTTVESTVPDPSAPPASTEAPGADAASGATDSSAPTGDASTAVSSEQLDMLEAKGRAGSAQQDQYEDWDQGDDQPERDYDAPAW